jgi:hypothetical protein
MTEEALSKTLKEKLNLYDEIDKILGLSEEEIIKTKKLPHESEFDKK